MCSAMQTESRSNFHPVEDGKRNQGTFLKALQDAFQDARQEGKRAELVRIQENLLKRGWHP